MKATIITVCLVLITIMVGIQLFFKMSENTKQKRADEIQTQLEYRKRLMDQVIQAPQVEKSIQDSINAGIMDASNGGNLILAYIKNTSLIKAEVNEFDRTNKSW